jgi:competence ComEA-like helix-hairpin-helix protein
MAIENFEWQGELTEPSQARAAETAAVANSSSCWSRLRGSVWLEPALRLGGMALLLAVLAGIGVVATTYAKPGLTLPEGPRAVALALGTNWLKATPPAESVSARPAASVPPLLAASAAGASPGASAPPPAAGEPPAEQKPSGMTADGKVVLNLASADELTRLPGVGMKRALAIVALRTKLKRFKHPSDLLRVKGIGPRGLQRMLPHLVLDA